VCVCVQGVDLKKIIQQAKDREFTDVLVINEDRKKPTGLLVIHLPDGPTAHFKLTSLKYAKQIKVRGVCGVRGVRVCVL